MRFRLLFDSSNIILAQLFARLLSFFYILKLAEYAGATDFGYLNLALSTVIVFDAIADIGLGRFLLRRASVDLAAGAALAAALLPLRLVTAGVANVAVVLFFYGFGFAGLAVQLTIVVAFGLYMTGVASLMEALLQSQSRFTYISLAHISLTVVQVATGLAVMSAGGGIAAIAATFVLTNLVYAAVVAFGVRRLGVSLRPYWDVRQWIAVIPQAAPFALILGLFILSSRIEIILVGWFDSGQGLGHYSVAARMMDAALVAPLALGSVVAPAFIRLHHGTGRALADLYSWILRLALLLSVAGAIAAMELAAPVVGLLLSGSYAGSERLVILMFAAYPFAAVYYLNLSLLLGAGQQRRTVALVAALVAAQGLWGMLLIPAFGARGAAAAFSSSMVVAAVASTFFVSRWYAQGAHLARAALPAVAAALPAVALVFSDGLALDPWRNVAAVAAYSAIAALFVFKLPMTRPAA